MITNHEKGHFLHPIHEHIIMAIEEYEAAVEEHIETFKKQLPVEAESTNKKKRNSIKAWLKRTIQRLTKKEKEELVVTKSRLDQHSRSLHFDSKQLDLILIVNPTTPNWTITRLRNPKKCSENGGYTIKMQLEPHSIQQKELRKIFSTTIHQVTTQKTQ